MPSIDTREAFCYMTRIHLQSIVDLAMAAFEAENIVSFVCDQLASDRLLRFQGIDRHEDSSNIDSLQQCRNRCDFIGFLANRLLPMASTRLVAHACGPDAMDQDSRCDHESGGATYH